MPIKTISLLLPRVLGWMGTLEPVLVSGGEPTLHPEWPALLEAVLGLSEGVVLFLTNGTWILDEDSSVTETWQRLRARHGIRLQGQVRTHPEYYPSYSSLWPRRGDLQALGFAVYDDAINITAQGRAERWKPGRQMPSCTNFRLMLLQRRGSIRSLGDLFRLVRMNSRSDTCKPLIDPEGNLYFGESRFCWRAGNLLEEADDAIFRRIVDKQSGFWQCHGCGEQLYQNYATLLRNNGL